MNANLGSGGTHIDTALGSINSLITSVGDGSSTNSTLPYFFLVTDGAQDNQVKGVPNGGWSGSNHASVINPSTVCPPLKNRGVIISVLYIPYVPINPVNASLAGDEATTPTTTSRAFRRAFRLARRRLTHRVPTSTPQTRRKTSRARCRRCLTTQLSRRTSPSELAAAGSAAARAATARIC